MNLFRSFVAVMKGYDYRDKLITLISFVAFVLMLLKLLIFPYGIFGFGENNIYTEGIVSLNGIQNLNPLFVDYNEADRQVSRLIFSGLMKYDPERKAVVDDMAQLSINEDKTVYTFKIREGIKWHDGKALTAHDVYFTFHDIIGNSSFPNDILKTNFSGVQIDLVDDMTIKFALEKPNVFFISNFVTGILPEHILSGVDAFELFEDEFNKKPIGTGPYMVTDAVEEFPDGRTQITIVRNPNYYGSKSEVEFMRFISYPTMEELISKIDIVNGVPRVSGKYISDFKNLERFELIPYELPQYTAVFMNLDSPIVKKDKVRLALQKAIVKEDLIGDDVDKIKIDTPLMQLDQEDWVYKSSPDEAEGAVKEAGYSYAEDDTEHVGVRYDDDGNALQLNLIARLYDEGSYQYNQTLKTVSFLQEAWEKVGFNIQVEFLPEQEFKDRIKNRGYDLLLVGQILGYNLDTYSYWHSSQADPMGQNLSNYRSFQIDTLIEDIRSTFDQKEQEKLLADLAKKLKEDIPALFLYSPIYYYASDSALSGIEMRGLVFPSDRFYFMDRWTFNR